MSANLRIKLRPDSRAFDILVSFAKYREVAAGDVLASATATCGTSGITIGSSGVCTITTDDDGVANAGAQFSVAFSATGTYHVLVTPITVAGKGPPPFCLVITVENC